jgi:hypothetical protein
MLFNPNWGTKKQSLLSRVLVWLKPKERSLPDLISWLEAKPPEGTYIYSDWRRCLAAQYNHATGHRYKAVPAAKYLHKAPFKEWPFENQLEWIACDADPRTFGGALRRAKELTA